MQIKLQSLGGPGKNKSDRVADGLANLHFVGYSDSYQREVFAFCGQHGAGSMVQQQRTRSAPGNDLWKYSEIMDIGHESQNNSSSEYFIRLTRDSR